MSAGPAFQGRDVLPASGVELRERIEADLRWARASAIDAEVVRRIVDPWTCPVALLPWLAWSLSVDVWSDDWPEATRRAVIAASPEVHRRKGTVRAVRLALDALGVQTSIREWWQASPPERRGTFRVRVTPDGSGPALDLVMLRQIREAVRRSKPKSRTFELEVALDVPAPIVVGGTTTSVRAVTLPPAVDPLPPALCPLFVAGFYGRGVRRVVIPPEQPGAEPLPAPVFIAATFGRTARPVVLPPYSP